MPDVFWAQCGASFVAWVGYGVWVWRRWSRSPGNEVAPNRPLRGAAGSALLFAGLAILLAGGWLLSATGGLEADRLTPLGWLIVTSTGVLFVHTQAAAAASMARFALGTETAAGAKASLKQENEETE